MVVWGWICPLQREVELEEIDGSPAALLLAAGLFSQTRAIYAALQP